MPMIVAAVMSILVAALVHSIGQFLELPMTARVTLAVGTAALCLFLFRRGAAGIATVLARGLLVTSLVLLIILVITYAATGGWAPAVAGALLAASIAYYIASRFARREREVPPPAPPAPPPAA